MAMLILDRALLQFAISQETHDFVMTSDVLSGTLNHTCSLIHLLCKSRKVDQLDKSPFNKRVSK